MAQRYFTLLDRCISEIDHCIHTLSAHNKVPKDDFPPAAALPDGQRKQVASMMRVNHAGEICAQALYRGQALTSRDPAIKSLLRHAASEEEIHLGWCQQRLQELDSHTSKLAPVWYGMSYMMGTAIGKTSNGFSMGFVAETERQVVIHLDQHLKNLPKSDAKSTAILQRMRQDENQHSTMALRSGGRRLPRPARSLMRATSRIMIKTAAIL